LQRQSKPALFVRAREKDGCMRRTVRAAAALLALAIGMCKLPDAIMTAFAGRKPPP